MKRFCIKVLTVFMLPVSLFLTSQAFAADDVKNIAETLVKIYKLDDLADEYLFGSFAAIWSQKISSCLCTAFRVILAESSYTQTFLEQLLRYDCLYFCKDWFHQELWLEG